MEREIRELAGTVRELIVNISGRINDISNRYRKEGIYDEDRIVSLFEDMDALVEGVSAVAGQYDSIDLSELAEKLTMMTDAMKYGDYSMLMDLLQYEVKELLDSWLGALLEG